MLPLLTNHHPNHRLLTVLHYPNLIPPHLSTTPQSFCTPQFHFLTPHLLPQPHPPSPLIHYLPTCLIYQDPTNEHGVGVASDSSPDKTVRKVVHELNVLFLTIALLTLEIDPPIQILAPLILQAQTSVPEVCELSDSSPARKIKKHHPSEAEKALAQTFLNRPDFPHYLLVTPPPEDLWDIFAKTMAANKKVFHVTPSKLDFSNQFLLQLATPSQWTDSLVRADTHMLDMHHKHVLQMENATFMPPTLTSLMQSKDRRFQAAVKKDKIRWDHRISKLILLPAIDLRAGHVDVLDSLPSLYDEEDVQRFLRPILQILPYLIRYLVKNNSRNLSPFTCQQRTGTYENTRSSDCGPVCAKFMELHLYGDPYPHMSGLTDGMVDKFHQQYAMEAYKTIVLPAYY
ncbi:unnamed protein product [Brassica oleracea]